MHTKKFALIGLCLTVCGCGVVKSSYNYTKGTQYLEAGDYQAARNCLEEAVRLDPTTSKNHNNLGVAYLELGDEQKALYHFHQAAMLDPANQSAVENYRGLMLELKKDAD